MNRQDNATSYLWPFATMVFLFFVVGFLTTANMQFQTPLKEAFLSGAGRLKNTLTLLITFSWFAAYPVFGWVGGRWVSRKGYQRAMTRGLVLMTAGVALFVLSAASARFGSLAVFQLPIGYFIFLLGSFLTGGAATVLQVVINPYLVACDIPRTQAVQRMAIGGSSNAIGTVIAPYFVAAIAFNNVSIQNVDISQVLMPYAALAIVILLTTLLFSRFRLPDMAATHASEEERLGASIWSFKRFRLGVLAIFCYVGCEVCVGGNINLYVFQDLKGSVAEVARMATAYWALILLGRLLGSTLRTVSPRVQLSIATAAASILIILGIVLQEPWLLVAVGFFHSIMWGCIYTLAISGLGKYTAPASGAFMTGVCGGAVFPLAQGVIADMSGVWRWSWLLVLAGETVMLAYALWGSRKKQME